MADRDGSLREIGDGVFSVDAPFEDAPNQVFLLVGERTVLVDSGVAGTPEAQLLPALAQLGLGPRDIDVLINTHGHHDHRGGNAALKAMHPGMQIGAHAADRRWIEDTEIYLDELYRSLEPNWRPPEGFAERIRRLGGEDVGVDLELTDGQTLDLGGGDVIEIRHVPAHSPGHVVVFHSRSATLFTGDSLQADGTPLQVRRPFFPYYDSVEEYEGSLDLFEGLAPSCIATSHHGTRTAGETHEILALARQMVSETHAVVADAAVDLETFGLADVAQAIHRRWPKYDLGAQIFRTARAHLRALESSGRVLAHPDAPDRWEVVRG